MSSPSSEVLEGKDLPSGLVELLNDLVPGSADL
jgi:hypothetical protein